MCAVCYRREWRHAHPESVKASNRKNAPARRRWKLSYYKAHPDKLKAKKQKHYQKHAIEIRAKSAEWSLAHPGYATQSGKNWRKLNPERARATIRAQSARRRSRASATVNTLTEQEWQSILGAYHHRCAYCGRDDVPMTQEHVIPILHGGGYTADNIIPACKSCNASRRTKSIPDFIAHATKRGRLINIHPLLIARLAT
jgi:hypothetical protein